MAFQKQVFINLPIKNLKASVDFFTKLGYSFNQQFTDETGTCMIISDTIYAMLLEETKFKTFIEKDIANAHQQTEVLIALNVESREAVDEVIRKAVAAGGKPHMQPQDHGFMYGHGYRDLDGHVWEIFYMDPDFVQKA